MKQRELKFRAWDVKENKMYHEFMGMDCHGEWIQLADQFYISGDDNFKLMQFTGLKDKEGKEIYEGDILEATRQTHEKQPLRDGNRYSKVVFEDGAFMASQSVQLNSKKIYTHGYAVIGNVFTTPELLKTTPQ